MSDTPRQDRVRPYAAQCFVKGDPAGWPMDHLRWMLDGSLAFDHVAPVSDVRFSVTDGADGIAVLLAEVMGLPLTNPNPFPRIRLFGRTPHA